MGVLYVVATPIGNLEDITLRAIRILRQVSLIAAEDTRHAQILKKHFELSAPITSYYEHNKAIKSEVILQALKEGDVALISDAGTPAISDPGVDIVRRAQDYGFQVCPIVGASALTAAISASGIAAPHYLFLGFLPNKIKERAKIWQRLQKEEAAVVIYEAPHRIGKTLIEMSEELEPQREVAVLREMTKLYEEIWRGTLAEATVWAQNKKGELVIVLSPAKQRDAEQNPEDICKLLKRLKENGLSAKEAAEKASLQTGQSKKTLYRIFLSL